MLVAGKEVRPSSRRALKGGRVLQARFTVTGHNSKTAATIRARARKDKEALFAGAAWPPPFRRAEDLASIAIVTWGVATVGGMQ